MCHQRLRAHSSAVEALFEDGVVVRSENRQALAHEFPQFPQVFEQLCILAYLHSMRIILKVVSCNDYGGAVQHTRRTTWYTLRGKFEKACWASCAVVGAKSVAWRRQRQCSGNDCRLKCSTSPEGQHRRGSAQSRTIAKQKWIFLRRMAHLSSCTAAALRLCRCRARTASNCPAAWH